MIGSVRAREDGPRVHVAKLIVHPEKRDRGLGAELLAAIEKMLGKKTFELATSEKSLKNLHLYRKMGYKEVRRLPMTEAVDFVVLEKSL